MSRSGGVSVKSQGIAFVISIIRGQRDAGDRPIRYLRSMTFTRITIDPAVCTGKPCVRGLRFPVARLLGLLAAGETREAILSEYPYLESEDIDEALRYAAFLVDDETVELAV
jgi:uncharacterized protein (DUF433 family)